MLALGMLGGIDLDTVVFWMAVFEGVFWISSWVIHSIARIDGTIVASSAEDRVQRIDKISKECPSYIVSLVHAFVCVYIGGGVLLRVTRDDVSLYDQYEGGNAQGEWMCCVFLAYIAQDLAHIVYQWPRLGRWDMVFHHLSFGACGTICGYHSVYILPFSWLTLGEASTVFLDVRWFLISSGRSGSKWLWLVNWLFACTFFLTRIVVYSLGLAHMAFHYEYLEGLWKVYPSVACVTLLLVLGSVLNFNWFRKIIARVRNPHPPTIRKKGKDD